MMRRLLSEVVEASCDSCKKSLLFDIGFGINNVNYALIQNNFGYGSRLDNIGTTVGEQIEHHLCEDCYEKVLTIVGLDSKEEKSCV